MSSSSTHGRRRAQPSSDQVATSRPRPSSHRAEPAATHGRRRAEATPKNALRNNAPARRPNSATARMGAVAAAGALLVTLGAVDHNATQAEATSQAAAEVNLASISVPSTQRLSFAASGITSNKAPTATPNNIAGSSTDVKVLGANGGPVNDPAAAKAYAATQLASFGWGNDQMACLLPLWTRESDWTTTAENSSSLAYGIAQSLPAEKMDIAGNDWRNNYQTQIKWGLSYIKDRYGSPCGAWSHETSIGWY